MTGITSVGLEVELRICTKDEQLLTKTNSSENSWTFVSIGSSGNTTHRAGHEIQAERVWVNNHDDYPPASSRPVSGAHRLQGHRHPLPDEGPS
ncbi:hypothetical protein [Arthrobacter sp. NPDC057013]|uniref:hypothetical protein n=1 Tax=Arthrobacter sp. NPDC057013 TaxID=3345999 RepID=UPI00362651B2